MDGSFGITGVGSVKTLLPSKTVKLMSYPIPFNTNQHYSYNRLNAVLDKYNCIHVCVLCEWLHVCRRLFLHKGTQTQ